MQSSVGGLLILVVFSRYEDKMTVIVFVSDSNSTVATLEPNQHRCHNLRLHYKRIENSHSIRSIVVFLCKEIQCQDIVELHQRQVLSLK